MAIEEESEEEESVDDVYPASYDDLDEKKKLPYQVSAIWKQYRPKLLNPYSLHQ